LPRDTAQTKGVMPAKIVTNKQVYSAQIHLARLSQHNVRHKSCTNASWHTRLQLQLQQMTIQQ
jgi:hypothetical protein